MKQKKTVHYIILPLLFTIFLGGCGEKTPASTGGFDPDNGLIVSGIVETEEVDLNTKIPGKITKIYIEEGQEVQAGDLIAEIDNSQLLAKKAQVEAQVKAAKEAVELQSKIADSNVAQAEGAYKAALAQLEKAKKGARSQELEQAKTYFEMMQKTYERVTKLYEKGAVSQQKKDEAEAQLKIAEQKYSLAKEGAEQEDIEAAAGLVDKAQGALAAANAGKLQVQLARQKYEEAKAGLAEVESLLADTRVLAPKSGTITELNSKEGELVSTGMPIATIADLKHLELNLKVLETDLGQVGLGQKVNVKFAGTGNKVFKGTVKKIGAKPDFATKKALNNQESDILAYEVKVVVDNLEGARIYPGMTAYVQFPKQP
ncbi:HlyD family secretion protein [Zhaonella formicivorans]|uniref:HlyD family secretion protein n=1 Tax=Zhaonella formicivorans TaxID=2528593 RepID=UPI0010F384F1|nr:HlyD family efflux transporter periplasmic adaptor subunit [Zhaonella formicivorans]